MAARVGQRVVFREPSLVEVEDFELTEPRENQLRVKTVTTLISPGTETAFLMALPNTVKTFPQYPGYSSAGFVEKLGKGAVRFGLGDRVVSQSPHASHVVVNEDEVSTIPDGVSYDNASFFSLGAIALQGVRKARIELGEPVIVLGQGLVGLMALQLVKLSGGFPVIGVDLSDRRLAASLKLGADYVINPAREDLERRAPELTDGKGASVVIEATGSPAVVPSALMVAGRFGRVILLGSTRGETTLNLYAHVHRKGLQIIGAHNSSRPRHDSTHGFWTFQDDSRLVLRLIERGALRVNGLATRASFGKARDAYEKLIHAKDDVIGILLDWTEHDQGLATSEPD